MMKNCASQIHRAETLIYYLVSPGILLRVLEVFGDESKVLAHLQPQVRLGYPAIVRVDGMVLGQLPGNKPAGWKRRGFELQQQAASFLIVCTHESIHGAITRLSPWT